MRMLYVRRPCRWLLPLILALGVPGMGRAELPQPSCVFYGEARDEYGSPYTTNAQVVLRVQGVECSRWTIMGMLAPGVNFKLPLELDDGVGTNYAPYAALPGQAVRISVCVNGVEQAIIQTNVPNAGQPGDVIAVHVTVGVDVNHDGLPDQWEQLLVQYSYGLLQSIWNVAPLGYFNGDRLSLLNEFYSGSWPMDPSDYLHVEETVLVGGRLRLKFLAEPGISYQVLGSAGLGARAQWQPAPFALTATDPAQQQFLVGAGAFVWVYLDVSTPGKFFRILAQ